MVSTKNIKEVIKMLRKLKTESAKNNTFLVGSSMDNCKICLTANKICNNCVLSKIGLRGYKCYSGNTSNCMSFKYYNNFKDDIDLRIEGNIILKQKNLILREIRKYMPKFLKIVKQRKSIRIPKWLAEF